VSDAARDAAELGEKLTKVYQSSLGKKLLTGITGLALASFVLMHMVGNLLVFKGGQAYNRYAHWLEGLGPLLALIELGLLLIVVTHAALGIQIFWRRRQARPITYERYESAGSPSLQSFSSRSMILTGSVVAVFLVAHLLSFKFGPYYSTVLPNGESARDLSRLVIQSFQRPSYAFGYTAVMVLLGLHLRHGLWSALQSLGVMSRGLKSLVYALSALVAVLIALGFLVLPQAIYWGWVGSL
jgi:succinate dehydrogenase / fumarate reductase cytochrome b subunit